MEHSFKSGDWVILSYKYDNATEETVQQYIGMDEDTYSFNTKLNNRNYAVKSRSTLKVWKPKLYEWCWFKTASGVAELGQYVGMTEIDHGKYQMKPSNVDTVFNYSYCEPFFGPLPTFIKQN